MCTYSVGIGIGICICICKCKCICLSMCVCVCVNITCLLLQITFYLPYTQCIGCSTSNLSQLWLPGEDESPLTSHVCAADSQDRHVWADEPSKMPGARWISPWNYIELYGLIWNDLPVILGTIYIRGLPSGTST